MFIPCYESMPAILVRTSDFVIEYFHIKQHITRCLPLLKKNADLHMLVVKPQLL